MNKTNILILSLIILPIVLLIFSKKESPAKEPLTDELVGDVAPIETETVPTQWEMITEALISVESSGNDSAVNGDCVGCLQLSSWFVHRCNEVAGTNYTLSDRYDREKSIEILTLMNKHFSDFSLEGACRLHNPKAGKWYKEKVKREYEKIRSKYQL